MKPFDRHLAKQGAKVVTRDGKPVRIICFDVKNTFYPILGLVEMANSIEGPVQYTKFGKTTSNEPESKLDLFMATEKKEGWICISKYKVVVDPNLINNTSPIYITEKAAQQRLQKDSSFIAIAKVEWEE